MPSAGAVAAVEGEWVWLGDIVPAPCACLINPPVSTSSGFALQAGAASSTHGSRRHAAGLAEASCPLQRDACADAVLRRRLPVGRAHLDGGDHARPQII